jgi:hypothetical protein
LRIDESTRIDQIVEAENEAAVSSILPRQYSDLEAAKAVSDWPKDEAKPERLRADKLEA